MKDPRDKSAAELWVEMCATARVLGREPHDLLRLAMREYLYPSGDMFSTSPRI